MLYNLYTGFHCTQKTIEGEKKQMASEKIERRRKIYELSVKARREQTEHLENVLCCVCEHDLWILSQSHAKYHKTCVFCGKTKEITSLQKEWGQYIDTTILGNQLTSATVDKLRELVMKKMLQDEEITIFEFSVALKLTKKYSDSHPYAGVFEYFEKILPPPKLLVMANEFAAKDSVRICETLSASGFRVTNDYGENVDLDNYDAVVVVNSDATIEGKDYPSYISADMDLYIRYAMYKSKKVFFTHPLPDDVYPNIRKPILPTDHFFLQNILARK